MPDDEFAAEVERLIAAPIELHDWGLDTNGEKRILGALLKSLGFDPNPVDELRGLSGESYQIPLVGVRKDHLVMAVSAWPTRSEEWSRPLGASLGEAIRQWKRQVLLASYDVRAALEHEEGGQVDLLIFRNAAILADEADWLARATYRNPAAIPPPPEETVSALADVAKSLGMARPSHQTYAVDYLQELGRLRAGYSIASWPVFDSEARALTKEMADFPDLCCSLGACYVSLSDLTIDEVLALRDEEDGAPAVARGVCERLSLTHFFRPPRDELILSTIDNLGGSAAEKAVDGIVECSSQHGHPPSDNNLLDRTVVEPGEILRSLQEHGLGELEYEQEFRIGSGASDVRQRIKASRAEPWYVKLASLLSPAKVSENVLKIVRELKTPH